MSIVYQLRYNVSNQSSGISSGHWKGKKRKNNFCYVYLWQKVKIET